jgi:hypothetical protein
MKTLIVIGLALGLGAAAADAAVVCARKNGRLVIRPACRANERPFDVTGFAVAGPAGPAGPEGPAGEPATLPVRLVDSIGQDVGEIHQLSSFSWVRIDRPPLEGPVLFFVDARGFPSTRVAQPVVWYASPGCAGVPYIENDFAALPRAQVCGSAAYHSTALSADREMQSYEFDYLGSPCPADAIVTPRGTCCKDETLTVNSIRPSVRTELVTLGLRPPFRIVRYQENAQ